MSLDTLKRAPIELMFRDVRVRTVILQDNCVGSLAALEEEGRDWLDEPASSQNALIELRIFDPHSFEPLDMKLNGLLRLEPALLLPVQSSQNW